MFSDQLLKGLKKKGITGNTLCNLLHIDNKNYTNWKNNKIPRGETLKEIANILNVSVDWLLEREDAMEPVETELIDNFRTSDEDGKHTIISVAELEARRSQKSKTLQDERATPQEHQIRHIDFSDKLKKSDGNEQDELKPFA